MADLALGLCPLHLLDDLELLHIAPALVGEGVHQVQVDVIRLKTLKLLVQDAVDQSVNDLPLPKK